MHRKVFEKRQTWNYLIFDQGLGLKPHHVINNRSAGGEVLITGCVDLEGHMGKVSLQKKGEFQFVSKKESKDGKKYLLDFSRTFPPVFKAPDERPGILWILL